MPAFDFLPALIFTTTNFSKASRAAPGASSDTWLFVVDRASVKKSSAGPAPEFSTVNRLRTATWIQGDKLYFLGTTGDERAIKQYL